MSASHDELLRQMQQQPDSDSDDDIAPPPPPSAYMQTIRCCTPQSRLSCRSHHALCSSFFLDCVSGEDEPPPPPQMLDDEDEEPLSPAPPEPNSLPATASESAIRAASVSRSSTSSSNFEAPSAVTPPTQAAPIATVSPLRAASTPSPTSASSSSSPAPTPVPVPAVAPASAAVKSIPPPPAEVERSFNRPSFSPISSPLSTNSLPTPTSTSSVRQFRLASASPPEDDGPENDGTAASMLTSAQDLGAMKSFSTSLTHNFSGVAAQVEVGAYATKRAASFLKKFAAAQDEYARTVGKLLAHEHVKLSKLQGDGMKVANKTWAAFLELMGRYTKSCAAESAEIVSQAAGPLGDTFLMLEEKRKEILQEERKCSLEMVRAREEVSKTLSHTVKLLDEAKLAVAHEKGAKSGTMGGGAGGFFKQLAAAVGKKPQELIKDATKSSQLYTAAIAQANKRQSRYIEQDMPKLFCDLQLLEKRRLDSVKARLTKFHASTAKFALERASILEVVRTTVELMNSRADIATFIQDQLYEHGTPIPRPPFAYDLPCTPADIEAGRLEGNPNSVFRSTLQHCMNLLPENSKHLDVPLILPTLINRIRELNGFTELGIFRISVSKEELDATRQQIDAGNYNVCNVHNAHVCAALLKDWIRLLAEPVIPSTPFYQQAIDAVAGAKQPSSLSDPVAAASSTFVTLTPAQQAAGVAKVFSALPALNQRVLKQIALMAREISEPKNAEISKMTVDNLGQLYTHPCSLQTLTRVC